MKPLERFRKPFQVVMFTLPWKQLPDYPDVGSYRMNADNSPAVISCADTFNDISNAAILLHEYIESFLCWIHGVTEQSVRDFDQKWFAEEAAGIKHTHEGPGDDPAAPYHTWHLVALRFEREFVIQNGMTWDEHEKNCERVFPMFH